jgi:exo-1,4-beta-D-glucosaminidase
MTMRHWPVDPLAARATAVVPGHVGGSTGLVDEDELSRVQQGLPGSPVGTLLGDIGPVLLLRVRNPRLWWPKQMGTPNLYDLNLSFETGGKVSDSAQTQFGIREITSEVAEHAPKRFKRLFKVNGKNILIRGAGWTPDMMVRPDPQRMLDEFRYVQDMGLNTVRLEGKLEPELFYETADRMGILVMAGWCCCDHWEHWGNWASEDFDIAKASLRDQMYRLRGHPSMVMWLNGSDNPPPPDVEEMYLKIEKDLLWPNPIVSSATAKPANVTGASGVKMSTWRRHPNCKALRRRGVVS